MTMMMMTDNYDNDEAAKLISDKHPVYVPVTSLTTIPSLAMATTL